MNTEENGPESQLDQAINEIRNEPIDPVAEDQAASRVWARLSENAGGALRSCADFRALLPAWRENRLPAARALLVEDHLHECPGCRRALAEFRAPQKVVSMPVRRPASIWHWAAAAAVVAGAGLTAWYGADRVLAPSGPRASVQTVSGILYKAQAPVAPGAALAEGEAVRTAKGSTSLVRLRDGSLVELRERTEVTFSEDRGGATLRLAGGSIIVRAAKQHSRHLYVATSDCTVAVTGTIFSVSSGVKGSRVSVIEGEVHVAQGKEDQVLHPGDQVSTSSSLAPVPLEQEIAWSQNVDQYLALLKEFSALRQKIQQLPGPGLRYASPLLDRAPDNTSFYAAIPNIGPTLSEANRLFQQQLQQSAVLREWWADKMKTTDEAKLNDALDRIRAFSGYLGQEIAVTVTPDSAGHAEPLILAEVARSGFREYLDQEIKKINAQAGKTVIAVVDDPRRATSGADELLVWINGNVVAASPDAALLARMAAAPSAFARTPFHARIAAAYHDGVAWLFALDLQSMVASQQKAPSDTYLRSGFADARYVVLQRREVPGGQAENLASLSFSQPRRGIASWLAAPAPMRSLEFVSADATFATALLLKNPALAIEDLIQTFQGPDFLRGMSEFEIKTGLNVRADLIQPLGGDVAVAIDGPLLPVPSWKLALEVNDPARFQLALERLASTVSSEAQRQPGGQPVTIEKEQSSGRTFYRLQSARQKFEVQWTYDSGFLVAAPSRDLLVRALQTRAVGNSLARSAKFAALLPRDPHANFSGMVYHSLGTVLAPLANTIQLTPEQRKALDAVASSEGPTLVLLYGEQDRIELASKGSFFGIGLDKLISPPGFKLSKRHPAVRD